VPDEELNHVWEKVIRENPECKINRNSIEISMGIAEEEESVLRLPKALKQKLETKADKLGLSLKEYLAKLAEEEGTDPTPPPGPAKEEKIKTEEPKTKTKNSDNCHQKQEEKRTNEQRTETERLQRNSKPANQESRNRVRGNAMETKSESRENQNPESTDQEPKTEPQSELEIGEDWWRDTDLKEQEERYYEFLTS
jgi:hypothetical protein